MMVGIGVAVAFLYSGTGSSRPSSGQVADEGRYMLLPAVPSDAVAVFCFSEAEGSCVDAFSKEIVEAAGDSRIAMSLHHSGKTLSPLYVIDAGRASDASSVRCSSIIRTACANGMFADSVSCGNLPHVRKSLSDRVLVVASPQENLVKSSLRHLQSAECCHGPQFCRIFVILLKVRGVDGLQREGRSPFLRHFFGSQGSG